MTLTTATRVPMSRARDLFGLGRTVVVSTQRRQSLTVSPRTTTHHPSTTTWEALEAACRAYGLRRQSFYVLDVTPEQAAQAAAAALTARRHRGATLLTAATAAGLYATDPEEF